MDEEEEYLTSQESRWASFWRPWLIWWGAIIWVGSTGWSAIFSAFNDSWWFQMGGLYLVAASGFMLAVAYEHMSGGVSRWADSVSRYFDRSDADAADELEELPLEYVEVEREPWPQRFNQSLKRYESLWMMAGVLIVPLIAAVIGALVAALMD